MNDFKILFVGENDHANLSQRMANAVNYLTGKSIARVYSECAHPFGYRQDIVGSLAGSGEELERTIYQLTPRVDWVIYGGDGGIDGYTWFRNFLHDHHLEDQPRAVRHAGGAYRANHAALNECDRALGARVVFMPCDLYRFARHRTQTVPYIPPTNLAMVRDRPIQQPDDATVNVGHIPSNADTKGSVLINEVFAALSLRARLRPGLISTTYTHPGALSNIDANELRSRCHVYVDQMVPEIGGFGVSAVEALAMGAVVVADIRHVDRGIDRFFRLPPISAARDAHELEEAVWLLCTQPSLLADLRRNAWEWARDVASYDAQGRYILQHLWARQPI
jgi:hypothetical protein